MASDPQARYPSVDALRADLQRWLRKQPVHARNGGFAYRTRRFVQRNALATTLVTVLALGLGGGAGMAWWQLRQIQAEQALASRLAEVFASIPGGARLPEWGRMPLNPPQALRRSEDAFRRSPLRDDRKAMARGLITVARGYLAIGNEQRGLPLIEEARQLVTDDPQAQARIQVALANLFNAQGRPAHAERAARTGVDVLGTPRGGDGNTLVSLYAEIARARWQQGERDVAVSLLDDTLREIDAAPERYQPDLRAELLAQRGEWLIQQQRSVAGKRDIARSTALAGTHLHLPDNTEALLATLQGSAGGGDAATAARDLLQQRQRELGTTHPETGLAWIALAEAQQSMGRPRRALASVRQALRIIEPTLGGTHPHAARALRVGALAQTFIGAHAQAVADARRAVATMETSYGSRHEHTIRARQALALSLGYASEQSEPPVTALLDEALAQYARLLQDGEHIGLPMSRQWLAYGIRLGNSGHTDKARRALGRALPELRKEYGEDSDYVFEARRSLATLLLKEQRHVQAQAELEQFAAALRKPGRATLYRLTALSDTLLDLAHLDVLDGRTGQARQRLEEALQLNLRQFGARDAQVLAIRRALNHLPPATDAVASDTTPR